MRIPTSSNNDGKIFLVRSPSENLPKTFDSPFMNETFSSRVFEVKLDRSRKFRVEIGSEEKNGCDGSVVGVGRLFACRVISDRRRAGKHILLWIYKHTRRNVAYLGGRCPIVPCPEEAFRRFLVGHRDFRDS